MISTVRVIGNLCPRRVLVLRLMGNSLLDITVYGRRAGSNGARKAKDVQLGRMTIEHVGRYGQALQDAGIASDTTSPMILPDYTGKIG